MLNKNNNFNGKFKLEPVKTYHLGFVMDVTLLKNCSNKKIILKTKIKRLMVIF